MLTPFPRIRPNPIAPPPLPLEPPPAPEPGAAEPATDIVPLSIEVPADAASDAAEIVGSPVSTDKTSTVKNEVDGSASTSVSDSDVFGAFLSGMATGNPEPFIVEITAQPAAPEPKEKSKLADDVSLGRPERSVEIAEPIIAASEKHSASDDGSSPDNTLAPDRNSEAVSEVAAQEDAASVSPELVVAAANIFDELDVLHEAAIASLSPDQPSEPFASATNTISTNEIQSGTTTDAAIEEVEEKTAEEVSRFTTPFPSPEPELIAAQAPATDVPAAISDAARIGEHLPEKPATADVTQSAVAESVSEDSVGEDNSAATAAPQITAQEPIADGTQAAAHQTESFLKPDVESHGTPQSAAMPAAQPSGPREEIHTRPAARSSPPPPKPRRAKGTFFGLARVPEPETMDDSGEVEAYASAAAQAHLDAIDDTFVAHAQLLLKGRERGRVLDIGTGPGQIVIKLGYRLTRWKFVGVDRSPTMIEKAMESLATAGELAGRVEFRIADGNALDFPDKSFEMVVCNSVLHHVPDPQRLFAEIARVVKPGGAILLRDLRRPSRPGYALHVWKHGRHYSGEMRRLFTASVQAAYTEEELQKMVGASPLRDVRVFRHGKTHIGFERAISIPAANKK